MSDVFCLHVFSPGSLRLILKLTVIMTLLTNQAGCLWICNLWQFSLYVSEWHCGFSLFFLVCLSLNAFLLPWTVLSIIKWKTFCFLRHFSTPRASWSLHLIKSALLRLAFLFLTAGGVAAVPDFDRWTTPADEAHHPRHLETLLRKTDCLDRLSKHVQTRS